MKLLDEDNNNFLHGYQIEIQILNQKLKVYIIYEL